MLEKQRTIEKEVSIEGTGLHTGTTCKLTFKPAPENYGIRFIRVDLGDKPEIPATADYVVDVSRGTTIGIGDAKVHTIEHVLAAIVGLQIDNIKLEIDGIEPPVMDGSSMSFVTKLKEAGFVQQDANKDYLIIDETITYKNEEEQVEFVALPSNSYRMTVLVDYQNPALGSQHSGMFDIQEFVAQKPPAQQPIFLNRLNSAAAWFLRSVHRSCESGSAGVEHYCVLPDTHLGLRPPHYWLARLAQVVQEPHQPDRAPC